MDEEIKRVVGYHNYFRIGVAEAEAKVQERCPSGWMARTQIWPSTPMPEGAVRVGQVKVHHGDPAYALYVCPTGGG